MTNLKLPVFGYDINYTGIGFEFRDKSARTTNKAENTEELASEIITELEVMNRVYIPEHRDTPYGDDKEYQRDWASL